MMGRYADGSMSHKLARKALFAGLWVKPKSKDFFLYLDKEGGGIKRSGTDSPYFITKDDEKEEWEIVTGIYEMTKDALTEVWNSKVSL